MTIGAGIFLAAVGAVLAFAVDASVAGVDVHAVGWILMLAAAAGVALDLAVFAPRRRTSMVSAVAPSYASSYAYPVTSTSHVVATTAPVAPVAPVATAPVVTDVRTY